MQTTIYGRAIIDEAQRWLDWKCHETRMGTKNTEGSNLVVCDNANNPKSIMTWEVMGNKQSAIPWCAAFGYEVIHRAAKSLGLTLPFENRKRELASVANWLTLNKNGVRIDKIPVPGAICIQRTTAKSHVAIVIQVDDDNAIRTIEGNMSDKVDFKRYKPSIWKSFSFVHVEEVFPEFATAETAPVLLVPVGDGSEATDDEDANAEELTPAAEAFNWANLVENNVPAAPAKPAPIIKQTIQPQQGNTAKPVVIAQGKREAWR